MNTKMFFERTKQTINVAKASTEWIQDSPILGTPMALGFTAGFALYSLIDFVSLTPLAVAGGLLGLDGLSHLGMVSHDLSLPVLLGHAGLGHAAIDSITGLVAKTALVGAGAQVVRRGVDRIPVVGEAISEMKHLD